MKLRIISIAFTLLFLSVNLRAAVLTVTSLDDTDDAACNAHCSLREAVKFAAANDTIIFDRALRGGTIQLIRTLLIEKALTIDAPNKRRITLKGNNTFRIIEARGIISIDGLIIRDGAAADGDGGGIYVRPPSAAVLNLTNVALLNNTAQRGGAIYMNNGTLYLFDSAVAGNTASAANGAGGVDVFRTTTRITNSTFSGNQSTSTESGVGAIKITDSQIFQIIHSTIVYNSSNGSQATSSVGGLLAQNGIAGPFWNTIIAQNTGLNPDFYGRAGGSHSLVGIVPDNSGMVNGVSGNIVGTADAPLNPQIGVLTDNGGGLPTHALLSSSRAIDAGDNELSFDRQGNPLIIDQRGYNRIINSTVDMGAYEFNAQPYVKPSLVTGQVRGANSRGISGAIVALRSQSGETRFAVTNPFGFYRFVNVAASASSYTIECLNKRSHFPAQNVLLEEAVEYINFQAN
jgi:CSLREA domain-containing protein